MELKRPLAVFDLETTGTDIAKDRIIEIAVIKFMPDGTRTDFVRTYNPGIPIPQEASEVHGIYDEDVKDKPLFRQDAEEIRDLFRECDVCGFNSNNFDVPVLVEEMLRCGIEIFDKNTKFIDVGTMFKKLAPRTLTEAVRIYLGENLEDAHSALADTEATFRVLLNMIERHTELAPDVESLSEFSKFEKQSKIIDYGRKLVSVDGIICYNIGSKKGAPVLEDPSFAEWMLGKDFPLDTKRKLRAILNGEYK